MVWYRCTQVLVRPVVTKYGYGYCCLVWMFYGAIWWGVGVLTELILMYCFVMSNCDNLCVMLYYGPLVNQVQVIIAPQQLGIITY